MHLSPALTSSLLTIFSLFSPASGKPLGKKLPGDFGLLARQSSDRFVAVTGVQDNGVQTRIEIRDMYHNRPEQFNIFVLGMQRFQDVAQEDLRSYYAISGIHGLPNDPWDGVQPDPDNGGAVGYCMHSSPMFPAWHRPYVALFEQELYKHILDIVDEFPDDQKPIYQEAAKTWRLPYWDYGATPPGDNNPPTFARIINSFEGLTVNAPDGVKVVKNPFKSYTFHPLDSDAFLNEPWASWNNTLRWPTSDTDPAAVSQGELAQAAMDQERPNTRRNIYNLFTYCDTYSEFSNDASDASTDKCSVSLEGIHDTIHNQIGGLKKGHMTWLWWSAFDPVFFLHHANIDRLYAMWQTIYPDEQISSGVLNGSTYTYPVGTPVGPETDLHPFHKDQEGNFWKAKDVESTKTFGYSYPDLDVANGNPDAMMSIVNDLYSARATNVAGETRKRDTEEPPEPEPEPEPVTDDSSPSFTMPSLPSMTAMLPGDIPKALGTLIDGKTAKFDWITNIQAQRFGMNGPFTVYVFVGDDFDEDPINWPFAGSFVGSWGFFSQSGMQDNKIVVSGAVPLTKALAFKVDKGYLGALESLVAVPYLQNNLHWRVADYNGKAVDPDTVPGLEVSVVMGLKFPKRDQSSFPKVAKAFTTLYEATSGKPGGIQIVDKSRAPKPAQ